jgi:hypothetical protein
MENHVVGEVTIKSQADENRINLGDFQIGFELFCGGAKQPLIPKTFVIFQISVIPD